ncbi:hypothetical protein TorRG33x02_046670 [Trema orientale]|uniref:Uncharacterized protein n=1 Tax=Trema orientale TaxID=63057 RepID=A0A2P5FP27_TREOI|nr:hypothetical protein TorRG33x02_046670 [Trema orientale]
MWSSYGIWDLLGAITVIIVSSAIGGILFIWQAVRLLKHMDPNHKSETIISAFILFVTGQILVTVATGVLVWAFWTIAPLIREKKVSPLPNSAAEDAVPPPIM